MAVITCIHCGHDKVRVIETEKAGKKYKFADIIPAVAKRRRLCTSCDARFTTYEVTERDMANLRIKLIRLSAFDYPVQ